MKKEFEVTIKETLSKKVTVKAENVDEANQIVCNNWHRGECQLSTNIVSFEAKEV